MSDARRVKTLTLCGANGVDVAKLSAVIRKLGQHVDEDRLSGRFKVDYAALKLLLDDLRHRLRVDRDLRIDCGGGDSVDVVYLTETVNALVERAAALNVRNARAGGRPKA